MKIPKEETLAALCGLRGVERDSLVLIGGGREDSDGIVYRAGDRIFKVISVEGDIDNELIRMNARLEFINYLGERGVSIAHPLKTEHGIYSVCPEGDNFSYIAYETPIAPGATVKPGDCVAPMVEKWGQLIGLTHRLTKSYPIWENTPGSMDKYGWQGEIKGFLRWRAGDEYCESVWGGIKKIFEKLPVNRDCYGFIHNDAHQFNTLWNGERLTLIDFDCAGCNFFLHDFVTPMQALLFEVGGMFKPAADYSILNRFFESFTRGYEREDHLSDEWYKRINLFINYRRVLLYSCMMEEIRSAPSFDASARRLIEECPEIIHI